jgi:precorrin-2 dehydrogenase/sirohydrochlorin ferrochelatase
MNQSPENKDNTLFPVFLKLAGRKCLVIGGGVIAARKTGDLARSGADVTVMSPDISSEMRELVSAHNFRIIKKQYSNGDLSGYSLVIDATGDTEVGLQVAEEAGSHGILVNVVDNPELCDFFVPSVHRQGHLTLAASSNGVAPALLKKIRQRWEQEYGIEYRIFLHICDKIREELKKKYPDAAEKRQQIMRQIVEQDFLEQCNAGDEKKVLEKIRTWISSSWE